jgi:hypothetical protein
MHEHGKGSRVAGRRPDYSHEPSEDPGILRVKTEKEEV